MSALEETLIELVKRTRKFGACYVPAEIRNTVFCYDAVPDSGTVYRISSYGRSVQSGGNKYKVSATYRSTGKPVRSVEL